MRHRYGWRAVVGFAGAVAAVALGACKGEGGRDTSNPKPAPSTAPSPGTASPTRGGLTNYTVDVVNRFPHDETAYTEGLEFHDGLLYESTGIVGRSSIRESVLETGLVKRSIEVPAPYFGEGITIFRGQLYQLTWKQGTGFIYDAATLAKKSTFHYTGEGWGLTHNDSSLIMSDGTSRLRFLDPRTLRVTRELPVSDARGPVERLNELEWVDGSLLANVWQADQIARIDPATGRVTAWIDCTALRPVSLRGDTLDVLNGIAYDSAAKRLLVTGKLWPEILEIKLRPQ